jgi:hypothetical protein
METRLNLLCEAGIIDKDICKGMMQVVNVLETEFHLPVRWWIAFVAIFLVANFLPAVIWD